MAHNLNTKDGKTSFAAYGEVAWHGLGQYFTERMTAEQAIKESNMDFTVEKKEIYVGRKGLIIPDRFATVRTDTKQPLGVVGKKYEIIQNVDAFKFFDAIIDTGEAIYETAGVLGRGERVFITAKLPDDITIKGDKISKYILLTTSHDGSTPLLAGFTPIRVVCNNTLTAALEDLTNRVVIRHRASAQGNIAEAARVMGLCSSYMAQVGKVFTQMAKVKITDVKLKEYLMQVLAPGKENLTKEEFEKSFSTRGKNVVDEMLDFALNNETQKTDATKHTLFGAYNTVSGFYNFNKEYDTPESRMADVMYGTVNSKVNRAFELAVSMIN